MAMSPRAASASNRSLIDKNEHDSHDKNEGKDAHQLADNPIASLSRRARRNFANEARLPAIPRRTTILSWSARGKTVPTVFPQLCPPYCALSQN
jgi:hypothetical protein